MFRAGAAAHDLAKLAERLVDGQDFFLGTVVDRLRQASKLYPHNQAIRAMERALESRFNKQGSTAFINQKQIQALYNDVAGLGNSTQVRETLDDLLFDQTRAQESPDHRNDSHIAGLRGGEELSYLPTEEIAAFSLALWGEPGNNQAKKAFLENGRRGIKIELESLGFAAPEVQIAEDNGNFVVYAAEVSTRKGRVPFLIPAEIKLGSVLMPSVFVSGQDFVDLTPENLRTYCLDPAKRSATARSVLATLNKITGKTVKQADVAPTAIPVGDIRLNTPELYSDLFAAGLTATPTQDAPAAAPTLPAALVPFTESTIKETLAEAGLSYSRDLVLQAKTMLANELKLASLPHDRIQVESEFKGGLVLATNLSGKGGKKRIEVPIEVSNNRIQMPTRFTSGAYASSFDEASLKAFAAQTEGAEYDPFLNDKIDWSFQRLHRAALNKAAYGDFAQATELLGVINDKFGEDLHRIAHQDLMDLLKVGYVEEERKPTAMEQFAAKAAAKAKSQEDHIRLTTSSMLFYPKD